ncbi:MAG: P-loop NTPase [Gemmatimonadota bacterium]|jgi:ATP-binding protein involved in chromosome partitioning|nr:sodium:proton antiporter [Gemmatimonadota bacterium]MDP6529234.1 P-loop NTPase [Gemmatimonadota bacterium]MDP6802895.1 P-loop NTPase [Gemmatimonadota bacterium]MDP7031435.1 P-loop NTPase [Gemmatimonadota bacterium]
MSSPAPAVLTGIHDVLAVHSAKGGVGKSTVAVNLAVSAARLGLKVGLLDADIHGPSAATMFGSGERPEISSDGLHAVPITRHGVRYLSVANVAPPGAPVIWRGPMVSSALRQLLTEVEWGELDLLVLDLPPGTGDAILAISQEVALSGAVLVTTPQDMSVADTRRGIGAFRVLRVPILGLVENMSAFACPDCGESADLFGAGGGERAARELELPFLGRIPVDPAVTASGDDGVPLAAADPESPVSVAMDTITRTVVAEMARIRDDAPGEFRVDWTDLGDRQVPDPPDAPDAPGAQADPATPSRVWQAADDLLGIQWADGEKTFHRAYDLRMACPCAECVEEWTREKLPSLDRVPRSVRPVVLRSLGRYALQPSWTDGHSTGIHSFADLRRTGSDKPE